MIEDYDRRKEFNRNWLSLDLKYILPIFDNSGYTKCYMNFHDYCRSQYSLQYESLAQCILSILKEKYNAWIRAEYNSLYDIERCLVFDTEEDKLEFVLTYS